MFVGSLVGIIATTSAFRKHNIELADSYSFNGSKLNAIWDLVDRRYVDPVNSDSVMDKVYSAILSTLDPHSAYLTKEVLKKEKETLRGNFEGVGIVLFINHDTVCVDRIIAGGPSERAGMEPGDRILSVDGTPVSGVSMPIDSVICRIRGPRKSIADIQIKRPTEKNSRIVKVVRDIINTPSVPYSGMIDNNTGYIRLSVFNDKTYDEFCDAVITLKKRGMKRMVLDLRDNGGGVLSAATKICDEFLPSNELIVYTQGNHYRREEVHSQKGGLFCEGELIVMIDEYSASASEIVAGAIQDNDRGIIVGRRSFGKGLVQQQFPLPDETAVLLTIARYYTPSGRCIQRPYNKGTDEYYADFVNHVLEEYSDDSILSQISDSTPYHTVLGRTVYGGGGILPDHIIHIKTDTNIVYYNKLINKGIVKDYAFSIVSLQGGAIKKKYRDSDTFINQYNVSDAMLEEMFKQADKSGISRNTNTLKHYKNEIRSRVKAEIGNMLYSSDVFYRILLPFDPELKEALNANIKL